MVDKYLAKSCGIFFFLLPVVGLLDNGFLFLLFDNFVVENLALPPEYNPFEEFLFHCAKVKPPPTGIVEVLRARGAEEGRVALNVVREVVEVVVEVVEDETEEEEEEGTGLADEGRCLLPLRCGDLEESRCRPMSRSSIPRRLRLKSPSSNLTSTAPSECTFIMVPL